MQIEFIRDNIKMMEQIQQEVSRKEGRLFNLTISGAHLYGFESPDSDIDYRGTFVINSDRLLGLKNPPDVIEKMIDENDIQLFEIKKEINLALKSNCNVLEHINAPQIYNHPMFLELKRLINNSLSKRGLYDSYRGMAVFNYKKFILGGKQTIKKYLYVFRALMAGIYVLQNGRIEPNLNVLNQYFKLPCVKQLIELKQANREMSEPPPELLDGSLEKEIDALLERLDDAYIRSKIPEEPDEADREKINAYLLKIRKEFVFK